MKTFLTSNIIAVGVLLAGCATGKSEITLDTVGPVPGQPAAITSNNGTLVVYSAYAVNADFNAVILTGRSIPTTGFSPPLGSCCRESIIIREPFFKIRCRWNFYRENITSLRTPMAMGM